MFFTKAVHIGFSSIFALFIGLVFNKLLALYYPYEYIGSFGLIKSYISTLLNVILIGINYSYFFLHKTQVDQGNIPNRSFMGKAHVYLIINVLVLLLGLALTFAVFETNRFILTAACVASVVALTKIYMQNDAVHSRFYRYFIYTGAQALIFSLGMVISFCFNVELIKAVIICSTCVLFGQIFYIYSTSIKGRYSASISNIKSFYIDSFKYSKFFFIHVFMNGIIISGVQYSISQYDRPFLTEFNVYIQLATYLSIFGSIFGTYLFPRLVKNSQSEEQYTILYMALSVVLLMALVILIFFDQVVSLLYKVDFVSLNLVFFLILNAKILEIINATQSIRFQSELKFLYLYSVTFFTNLPMIIYLLSVYFFGIDFSAFIFITLYFIAFALQFIIYGYGNKKNIKNFVLLTVVYVVFFVTCKAIFIDSNFIN
tara:strand:+ start:723 stop:2009 length:1287 start_codon:yes stop_codon:yes gene_type:complete